MLLGKGGYGTVDVKGGAGRSATAYTGEQGREQREDEEKQQGQEGLKGLGERLFLLGLIRVGGVVVRSSSRSVAAELVDTEATWTAAHVEDKVGACVEQSAACKSNVLVIERLVAREQMGGEGNPYQRDRRSHLCRRRRRIV